MIFSIPPIDSHPACITLTSSFQQVREPDRRCPTAECTGEKEDWWHHRTLFWKILSVAQVLIIPCPDICRGQLSDLRGSLDLPHTLYQI
ncbi:hypothetical protein QQF64_016846 [Cirrhinus molitorella]|uniref:Uncharacterized protein n=1 Tax=Cirrhinus molitorella TaxID=172907 RepID=A0ABR3LP19_9TELE